MYDNFENQSKKSLSDKLYEKMGFVEESKGIFKNIYEVSIEKGVIVRKTVVNIVTKEVFPDETKYRIISDKYTKSIFQKPAIHAIGTPGICAYELLTISGESVISSRSMGDYIIISNMKIIKRTEAFPSISIE